MSSTPAAAEARAILYPYQRRWIDDQSRFKIGMFSRQTGKTYTSTLEIAEDMVKAEVEKRRVRWVILSRGERQAREAMEEASRCICGPTGPPSRAWSRTFTWRTPPPANPWR